MHFGKIFSFILVDLKRYFDVFIQYNGEYLLEQQNSDACFCKITCLVQSVLCKEPNRKHFNQSRHLPHHVIALNFGIPSRDHQMIT